MKVSLPKYPKDMNKERKIKIQIDPWDTWNMDSTLALIIHPMLVQLQKTKQGSPWVDDEDVPDELKSTSAPPKENEWDSDDNLHKRWDWVLNEMIWGMYQLVDDKAEEAYYIKDDNSPHGIKIDHAQLRAWQDRKSRAFKLFGKYFEGLWD